MKKIVIAIVASTCLFGIAETTYQLKSDVYAYMLDESGNKVRSGKIRAGTKIIIVQNEAKEAGGKSGSTITSGSYIAPKMFKASMPKMKPVEYSCECEISDLYCGEFYGCEKTHWSVSIKAYLRDGSDYESLWGYVAKSSPIGKKVSSILSDGKEHKMILVVRYTKNAEDSDSVEIVGVK